jgi:hypothetical protein
MGASSASNNITLGGAADSTYYSDKANVNITTEAPNQVNYTLTSFEFGIVYTNADGADESEYFESIATNDTLSYASMFDTAS